MDLESIKKLLSEADLRNNKFTSEAKSLYDAIKISKEYAIILYQKDKILEIISKLKKTFRSENEIIWTPSGEDFNEYISKCYLLARKREFVPASYHFPVFENWAKQIMKSLTTMNPDTSDLILRSNIEISKLEFSAEELNQAFRIEPNENFLDRLSESKELLLKGEIQRAFKLLLVEINNNPENEDLNFLLGICSLLLKKNKLALNYFIDAAQYSKDWDDSSSIKQLRQIIQIALNPKKHLELFKEIFSLHLNQEIISNFNPGLEIDLSFIKKIKKDLANQLDIFEKSNSFKKPDNALKIYHYASYLYSKNRLPFDFIVVARNYYFRENLSLQRFNYYTPNTYDSVILQIMGVFLIESKMFNEAKYFLVQSIIIQKKNHQAYQSLGDAFRYTSEFSIAIKCYERCLEIISSGIKTDGIDIGSTESFKAEYYYCLGMAHQGLEEFDEAEDYFRKAKELPHNYYFGFVYDGYTDWEGLIAKTLEIKKSFELLQDKTEESTSNSIEEIHSQITNFLNRFDITEFSNKLIEKYNFVNRLSPKGKACFTTAEFLFNISPTNLPDYSHIMVEYCKVLENELYEKIISKLSEWALRTKKSIITGKNSQEDVNRFNRVTLGNYPYLIKQHPVLEFIEEMYLYEDKTFINELLTNKIRKIINLRNDSAHLHICGFDKVLKLRRILIDSDILEGVSKL